MILRNPVVDQHRLCNGGCYDVPAGAVFSSHDYLFTSGTLGRYCSRLNSTNEAKDAPWSSPKNSSTSTQSWWYR